MRKQYWLTALLLWQGEAQVSVWNSSYQDDDICIRGKILIVIIFLTEQCHECFKIRFFREAVSHVSLNSLFLLCRYLQYPWLSFAFPCRHQHHFMNTNIIYVAEVNDTVVPLFSHTTLE